MEFKDLVKKVIRYNNDSDIVLLEKAYNFSTNIIKNKLRASGAPWIDHYLKVAYEVTDLKSDDTTIAAALMHGILNKGADVKELKKNFSDDIVSILENIERMSIIKKNVASKTNEIESLRKVLLAAARDVRAIIIKICDKLVNLRDLEYLNPSERKRIAKEAIEIYAPLAYRLGMGKIKSDIEDLAFKYIDEQQHSKLEAKVNAVRKEGEKFVFKFKRLIEKELSKEVVNATVQARVKHLYSIYKKMIEKSYDVKNMSDIVGFRIIVDNLDDCYKALKIVHTSFRPIPNRFKDYIAIPKPNGYQSLHTSVVDDEGRIFEIQIRTQEMHDFAEEGIASHFIYKKQAHGNSFDRRLTWLKQLVETKEGSKNFNVDFFGDQIFSFTPKGNVIEMPSRSTVLDFAFTVHSDLGYHCIGANVNGRFVSLKDELDNGDVVDILTSKSQKISRDWLKFVRTSKAREKIKQRLREQGKLPTKSYSLEESINSSVEESFILFEGDKKLKVKIALCCKPIPGDNILGVKVSHTKLMIHKNDCKDIIKTEKKKIKVKWLETFKKPIKILISAKDRPGLFKEILNSVNNLEVPITHTKIKVISNEDIECSFDANVGRIDKLNEIINRTRKIKNVKRVYVNTA